MELYVLHYPRYAIRLISYNFSAIITVLPFFLERLSGALHDSFASWLSFLFNGVGLVAMGLATWLGGRVRSKLNLFL